MGVYEIFVLDAALSYVAKCVERAEEGLKDIRPRQFQFYFESMKDGKYVCLEQQTSSPACLLISHQDAAL